MILQRIRDHDGALSSPQQTSTDTKQHTSEDIEAEDIRMNRDQQADGIDTVSDTSKGQSPLDTDLVDESSTKETEDRKRTVERRVLILSVSN